VRRLFVFFLCIFICISTASAHLVASKSSATSITLTWEAPRDGCDGATTQYDFRYSTVLITNANWNSAIQVSNEPIPRQPGQAETLVILNLTPGVKYYFAAKVADSRLNWSSLSSVVMRATLLDNIAPAVISTLRIIISK
jgi:hypothetical protein